MDVNFVAARNVATVTNPTNRIEKKNPAAVALGRLGGIKGGKARAEILSPEGRSTIARKAALASYAKKP